MKTLKITCMFLLFIAGIQLVDAQGKNADTIVQKEVRVIKNELSAGQKDSILYEKLSADQLMELKLQEAQTERERIDAENRNEMPLNGAGIVLIVLIPFVFVVIMLTIIGNIRNRESKRRYDLYMKSLEMGQAIPEHFFEEPEKKNVVSNLKKGILWLAIGLAIVVSCIVIAEKDALFLGIIPAFVGLGYLLVHYLDKPKQDLPE